MNDPASARRLHDSTKHGTPPASPESLVGYQRLDPRNVPRPFKQYRGRDQVSLPRALVQSSLPATEVLSGVKGETSRLDSSLLATLLFLSAGVTRTASPAGRKLFFRAAMSAGNLHPVEVYVVVGEEGVDGLGAGVYHFSPLEVGLTRLRRGDHRDLVGVAAPVGMVLTGIPWRTTWKYGERGWRHLYWDSGTMLANLLTVADSHGLEHRTLLGFDDQAVNELLGIDGATEMSLAMVQIGSSEVRPPSSRAGIEPLTADTAPVAPRPVRLPLLEEAQAGSVLSADEVVSWREAGSSVAREAAGRITAPEGFDHSVEEVILRRGSTRRMVHRPLSAAHLRWPLKASGRAVGIDAMVDGTLLDHYVNVHAVEGLSPGAYRLGDTGLELLSELDSPREHSARLCLGQPLGGDSAYTVFHCADLGPVLGSLGSRGYRVAQMEAGVVSGRLALCVFAMDLGATGLTFFDDAVSTFFGTPAQPMLVTSVGIPATSPAPSGSPGQPAVLDL